MLRFRKISNLVFHSGKATQVRSYLLAMLEFLRDKDEAERMAGQTVKALQNTVCHLE